MLLMWTEEFHKYKKQPQAMSNLFFFLIDFVYIISPMMESWKDGMDVVRHISPILNIFTP